MLTMGGLSSNWTQRRLVLFLSLLLQLHPSLAYSLKHCSIEYSQDPLADVALDCAQRELLTVPDDIPRDVSSLRFLYLGFNQIAHMDDGSFIHLTALTTLDIHFNKLTKLTGNLFQGLSNLTKLDLSFNSIHFIHTSAFQFLPSLQTLRLEDNKLQQMADIQAILQLPNLLWLSISNNLFHSFQTKDLQLNVSSSLKALDISENVKLENFSITTPIFPHLESIDFSSSGQDTGLKWDIPDKSLLRNITKLYFKMPVIPFKKFQNVLRSLDSLTHLRLNYMMKWINRGLLATVCKIPTLRKLELYYNNVANLSAKLVTCTQLSDLDLSIIHMTELSKGSIRSMQNLRSLNVEVNLLTKVPEDIRSLSSLEILNLSDNLISILGCEDFINTTHLIHLDLSVNRISRLDGCAFQNLTELKVLDLSGNLLWTFADTFKAGPQKLEFLDLSKNFLSLFEKGDFQGLGSVKYLDVVSRKIRRVKHKAFDGMTNLRNLRVSLPLEFENNFRELQQLENLTVYFNTDLSFKSPLQNYHKSFYHLKSLKVFTMICKGYPFDVPKDMLQAMKHLEDFSAENVYIAAPDPNTFQYNPHLKNLTLRDTDLSGLDPELFLPIPNLQVLEFSNSKLKSLDFLAQSDLSALRHLTLSNNELTVINETVFQSLPALTYLDLENNPFTCDCSNARVIQWVKSNDQTQVVNAYQYTCSFPVAEQGAKLLDFDIQSCWMDYSFLCFISSTCLVLLTLLSSFIYHFLRWQLAYTFRLFLAFLYDRRKRSKRAPHCYDAFISYNVHNEDWVYREMLPVLEGEQGWRLCLHHRDFQPGKPIIENITDTIYSSRKTICVISRRYLQSEWCSREIQMASFRLFDEQKDVLVLLFLEEIPARQLSPYYRMRKLVKRRTYLSWPQAGQHTGVFWQNVQRALETGDSPTETTDLLTGPAGR
nr:toll-like receptor 13 isoform a [Trachinotus ovatus]